MIDRRKFLSGVAAAAAVGPKAIETTEVVPASWFRAELLVPLNDPLNDMQFIASEWLSNQVALRTKLPPWRDLNEIVHPPIVYEKDSTMPDISPHSDNTVRVAVNWAAGELNALARDLKAIPTFGLEPTPDHFRSRAALVKLIATIADGMLTAIGEEGASHTHGDIPAEDYKSVCSDAVYNDSLSERFNMHADKMDAERRDADRHR